MSSYFDLSFCCHFDATVHDDIEVLVKFFYLKDLCVDNLSLFLSYRAIDSQMFKAPCVVAGIKNCGLLITRARLNC